MRPFLFPKKDNNSHYETDFGVSSAEGAGNTKIDFLKARHWRAFKKSICIMRIAAKKRSASMRSSFLPVPIRILIVPPTAISIASITKIAIAIITT